MLDIFRTSGPVLDNKVITDNKQEREQASKDMSTERG